MTAVRNHPPQGEIRVDRWPTELPLMFLVILSSGAIWILLAVSVVGIVYAGLLGLFFFVSHLVFIAYLRGSGVKLGPDQMPELHRRVAELAGRIGLRRTPDVYVMQAGGTLNALATRFFAAHFVVLFSDLLEACGDNTQARDMIIGHELGHLKAGHLRGVWFLLPGFFVPFLGMAFSRAREYTCDRYGAAVCEDRAAALRGLAILAAGGAHGRRVKLEAFARQREDLNRAWMTIGHWLGTHPPLAHRVAALDPMLAGGRGVNAKGAVGALAILGSLFAASSLGAAAFALYFLPAVQEALGTEGSGEAGAAAPFGDEAGLAEVEEGPTVARLFGPEFAGEQARRDIRSLVAVVEEFRSRARVLPKDMQEVNLIWGILRPGVPIPTDPFDGFWYGYRVEGEDYVIWSIGPDVKSSEDDIRYVSAEGIFP